ncbi:MAG: TetR/AcrR family transcriptional regulator [Rhizobiaceae bacterium]|nr:TetR/AcrR family transcriptional regulator [Rhizobiaceae bacterium]
MARPREFDTDQAIGDAMNVFWELGYEEASLPDLLKGMGLTRGSLYKAFKDKKTLFLTAIARYETDAVQPAVKLLTGDTPADGVDRINTLFQSIVSTVRNGDRRGCLLCSAAAGPAADDQDISRMVQGLLNDMQNGFALALADSRHYRTAGKAEHERMASLLLSQYVGLRILARSRAPLAVLDQSVAAVVGVLGRVTVET